MPVVSLNAASATTRGPAASSWSAPGRGRARRSRLPTQPCCGWATALGGSFWWQAPTTEASRCGRLAPPRRPSSSATCACSPTTGTRVGSRAVASPSTGASSSRPRSTANCWCTASRPRASKPWLRLASPSTTSAWWPRSTPSRTRPRRRRPRRPGPWSRCRAARARSSRRPRDSTRLCSWPSALQPLLCGPPVASGSLAPCVPLPTFRRALLTEPSLLSLSPGVVYSAGRGIGGQAVHQARAARGGRYHRPGGVQHPRGQAQDGGGPTAVRGRREKGAGAGQGKGDAGRV